MLDYIPCQSAQKPPDLKFAELLTSFIASINLQHIEPHGLTQWSTLSNSHIITLFDPKARRDMGCEVLVTLLVSIVFLDVVEIVTAIMVLEGVLLKYGSLRGG